MSDYKELLRLSKKAADAWRNDGAYYQAAVLIDSLYETVETLLAERDAAVDDLKQWACCDVCKNKNLDISDYPCCDCFGGNAESTYDKWQWRGIGGSDGT